MKKTVLIHKRLIVFSRWSNRSYSAFASLGKEVYIASLLTHMYQNILLKSSRKGIIINTDKCWEYLYNLFCLTALFDGFKFNTKEGEVCPDFLCKP